MPAIAPEIRPQGHDETIDVAQVAGPALVRSPVAVAERRVTRSGRGEHFPALLDAGPDELDALGRGPAVARPGPEGPHDLEERRGHLAVSDGPLLQGLDAPDVGLDVLRAVGPRPGGELPGGGQERVIQQVVRFPVEPVRTRSGVDGGGGESGPCVGLSGQTMHGVPVQIVQGILWIEKFCRRPCGQFHLLVPVAVARRLRHARPLFAGFRPTLVPARRRRLECRQLDGDQAPDLRELIVQVIAAVRHRGQQTRAFSRPGRFPEVPKAPDEVVVLVAAVGTLVRRHGLIDVRVQVRDEIVGGDIAEDGAAQAGCERGTLALRRSGSGRCRKVVLEPLVGCVEEGFKVLGERSGGGPPLPVARVAAYVGARRRGPFQLPFALIDEKLHIGTVRGEEPLDPASRRVLHHGGDGWRERSGRRRGKVGVAILQVGGRICQTAEVGQNVRGRRGIFGAGPVYALAVAQEEIARPVVEAHCLGEPGDRAGDAGATARFGVEQPGQGGGTEGVADPNERVGTLAPVGMVLFLVEAGQAVAAAGRALEPGTVLPQGRDRLVDEGRNAAPEHDVRPVEGRRVREQGDCGRDVGATARFGIKQPGQGGGPEEGRAVPNHGVCTRLPSGLTRFLGEVGQSVAAGGHALGPGTRLPRGRDR